MTVTLPMAIDAALSRELRGARSPRKQRTDEFSCVAVWNATDRISRADDARLNFANTCNALSVAEEVITKFNVVTYQMGLDHIAFDDIRDGKERQQARALWLTWVKLMVEEGVV